jgi:hypothetical protein
MAIASTAGMVIANRGLLFFAQTAEITSGRAIFPLERTKADE